MKIISKIALAILLGISINIGLIQHQMDMLLGEFAIPHVITTTKEALSITTANASRHLEKLGAIGNESAKIVGLATKKGPTKVIQAIDVIFDKFGNEWIAPESPQLITPDGWKIDLSEIGQKQIGWLNKEGMLSKLDSQNLGKLVEKNIVNEVFTKNSNNKITNLLLDESNLVKPLGRGSTGRTIPKNLHEQLAMKEVMSNPKGRELLDVPMTDPRWPQKDGWVKVAQNIENSTEKIEIHYVKNKITDQFDDFKFKK